MRPRDQLVQPPGLLLLLFPPPAPRRFQRPLLLELLQ